MEMIDAVGVVGDYEGALPRRVLRRDDDRTAIGVAALRLKAAQGEHEAARRIAPVCSGRDRAAMSKPETILPQGPIFVGSRADADQRLGGSSGRRAAARQHAEDNCESPPNDGDWD